MEVWRCEELGGEVHVGKWEGGGVGGWRKGVGKTWGVDLGVWGWLGGGVGRCERGRWGAGGWKDAYDGKTMHGGGDAGRDATASAARSSRSSPSYFFTRKDGSVFSCGGAE